MRRSRALPASAVLAVFLAAACATAPPATKPPAGAAGVADWTLGLEKSAVTGGPAPSLYEYGTKDPGDGKSLEPTRRRWS